MTNKLTRGETFAVEIDIVDRETGDPYPVETAVFASQISRCVEGVDRTFERVDDLTVLSLGQVEVEPGKVVGRIRLEASAAQTRGWPSEPLYFDVYCEHDGVVVYVPAMCVSVGGEITPWPGQ